jgi:hypothetical protein
MIVNRSEIAGICGYVPVMDSWSQVRSHRWARTSLHRVVPLPATVSTSGAITSLIPGQLFAGVAGVRWKKYLLNRACAIPVESPAASFR